MNHLVCRPTLAGGIFLTAVLATLAPTFSSRASGQITFRIESGSPYNPYGQGPYGSYGEGYDPRYDQGYVVPFNQGRGGRYIQGAYGYPGYRIAPNRYGYGYRNAPYVRRYGRTVFYQPSYAPVYVPFGYGRY